MEETNVTGEAQRALPLRDLAGGASVLLAVALWRLGQSRMAAGRYAKAAYRRATKLARGRAVDPVLMRAARAPEKPAVPARAARPPAR